MPVEVYPIVAITGLAVCGASWYLTRLARSPDVIWDKKGEFDKVYKRDRL
ncbi:hypothetical protein MGL_3749 [Malassezia globosa CBS 7966]|uniref:Uncharacterized protein n=1 Tax=Malassezia globosa (strain ATCC MYA-4612 / CBS 7966) TaxID=425265 RepID=A8QAJ0_MALGO|nr:uncharacterized protein MGL_3749 [Malassezia globosa CBS 7966]EDP42068.1 hypothetical protein MGL_3749 [Malassezia globosa CBS 7966]